MAAGLGASSGGSRLVPFPARRERGSGPQQERGERAAAGVRRGRTGRDGMGAGACAAPGCSSSVRKTRAGSGEGARMSPCPPGRLRARQRPSRRPGRSGRRRGWARPGPRGAPGVRGLPAARAVPGVESLGRYSWVSGGGLLVCRETLLKASCPAS